jgi:uncharacterized damage-inducible protein DinB
MPMDSVAHFRRLFAYDDWANRETLGLLQARADPPQRSLELLAHIVSAKRLWLDRILGTRQTMPVWPDFRSDQYAQQVQESASRWADYLSQKTEPELEEKISYQNTIGESFSSRIDDIMMHVSAHGAYHRGQVAADMRAHGLTPAYTDFIHSIRQGFVE